MTSAICDAHVHVFEPQKFPYVTTRRFTPGVATVQDLRVHLDKVGASQVVLVQPSVYGENNDCLLSALTALSGNARGVVVLTNAISGKEIDSMHQMGVRGARLNLLVDHTADPDVAISKLAELEAFIPPEWHIQLHVSSDVLGALFSHIENSSRKFVLDHLGLPDVTLGTHSFAWQRQLALLKSGNLYVKLSAPYLSSKSLSPYADLDPFLDSLLLIRPDRLLWGSNWPHTQGTSRNASAASDAVEEFRVVDESLWLRQCTVAAGSSAVAVFEENARRLYDHPGCDSY